MKTNTTKPCLDLRLIEKDLADLGAKYGFDFTKENGYNYDLKKLMDYFIDTTVQRVISGFCEIHSLKFDYEAQQEFKDFDKYPTGNHMLKALENKYSTPEETSFSQLIESLRPETPEYWIRDGQPGSKYNTLENYEKQLKSLHEKRFTCRFNPSSPWYMERAIIALNLHLTGTVIEGFKDMLSSYSEDYLTKRIEIINKTITADFKIKAFKNGRLDITFFNAPVYGKFLDRFIALAVSKFKKYLQREAN